jgi:hypothetical protein
MKMNFIFNTDFTLGVEGSQQIEKNEFQVDRQPGEENP